MKPDIAATYSRLANRELPMQCDFGGQHALFNCSASNELEGVGGVSGILPVYWHGATMSCLRAEGLRQKSRMNEL